MAAALHASAEATARPAATFRSLAGLRLELTPTTDHCYDERTGVRCAGLRATLWTRDQRMVAFRHAPLRDCRPEHVEGSTDDEQPVIWIGGCAFDLLSLAEARRAWRWLQQQQQAAA